MEKNLSRYRCQTLLKELGKNSQEKFLRSKVAIVGLGALGSVSAQLLARAGVGNIILIDRDVVELRNLHRQFYSESDVGKPKATVAKNDIKKVNSDIKITSYPEELDQKNISKLLGNVDLILDCTDNLETRYLINDFALKKNTPWVYGAAIGSIGCVLNIFPHKGACLKCLIRTKTTLQQTCGNIGILNTASTTVAALQSTEALKILLNRKPSKDLLYFDLWKGKFDKIKVKKDPRCPACG